MAHFLSHLLNDDSSQFQLVNARTDAVVASMLLTAFDSASRRTGLLNHTSLSQGTAMIIAPCSAVHTFFMKFPIDVVFVAKDGRVLKVRRSMAAWRLSGSFGAFATIECAAGQVPDDVRRGDVLSVVRAGR